MFTSFFLCMYSCKVSDVIRHFSDAFREADEDGDGFLSERELGIALRKLGHNPSEVEIRDLILTVDEDGSYYFIWISYFQPLTASSVIILVNDTVSPSLKNL